MDDVLVYKGNLKACPPKETFSVKNHKSRNSRSNSIGSALGEDGEFWWVQEATECGGGGQGGYMDLSQSILFTNDPDIISREVSSHKNYIL